MGGSPVVAADLAGNVLVRGRGSVVILSPDSSDKTGRADRHRGILDDGRALLFWYSDRVCGGRIAGDPAGDPDQRTRHVL